MRTRNADKQLLVKQKAIEMLVADGFQGFSMNRLAAACGDFGSYSLYLL
jgi:hypothetical protein